MSEKTKICVVAGPTASGKTALGVEICKRFNGEVVSCDSMQIYKGLPIATAVPTMEEREGIPHHLMEFLELNENFSVADYVSLAKEKIEDITKRGKLPVFVGGTGLYISSLLDNVKFAPQQFDENIRKELNERIKTEGCEKLYSELMEIDPETAKKIHVNDALRITRALEIYLLTGETKTQQVKRSKEEPSPYDPCVIGLNFENRDILYDRINRRVDIMTEQGMLDEVKAVYEKYGDEISIAAIGYKEFIPYLKGEETLENCIENVKQESRRYAKRQLTWFRRDSRVNWIYPDSFEENVEYSRTKVLEKAIEIMENSGN
ncbi:MAG: tRNA (adenosine(37)-N6)-dimethylallyltransferase MiaA [Clostridia bacterium]|nr:tRNA (adenosine(37)-N6)-dimethylallyltransferase MiaA [Clostridia bacterium]